MCKNWLQAFDLEAGPTLYCKEGDKCSSIAAIIIIVIAANLTYHIA